MTPNPEPAERAQETEAERIRNLRIQAWSLHINRCEQCSGYPSLCARGKELHIAMRPEDWDMEGNPTRGLPSTDPAPTAAQSATGQEGKCQTCGMGRDHAGCLSMFHVTPAPDASREAGVSTIVTATANLIVRHLGKNHGNAFAEVKIKAAIDRATELICAELADTRTERDRLRADRLSAEEDIQKLQRFISDNLDPLTTENAELKARLTQLQSSWDALNEIATDSVAEIAELRRRIEAGDKALRKAASVFHNYATIHLEKSPPDVSKAKRNSDYGLEMSTAAYFLRGQPNTAPDQ